MRFRFLAFLPALALLFNGCAGYQLGPIKPKTMRNVTTIAIPSIHNETLEPRVEVLLADAIIKQFQQDGTFKIADEKSADAIVECVLEDIIRRPSRAVRGNVLQTREFTLVLRVSYRVLDRQGHLLDQRVVLGTTTFYATGSDILAADVDQDARQAIPRATEDVATHLVSQLSEGW